MIVTVKVKTKGKVESLIEKEKGNFVATLTVPREKNLANKRLIELLAEHYSIPRSAVKIIAGKTGVVKKIRIRTERG